jgi:hypothetical protein
VKLLLAGYSLMIVTSVGCSRERHGPAAAPIGSAAVLPESNQQRLPNERGPTERGTNEPRSNEPRCREQTAQDFLRRAHLNRAPKSRVERKAMLADRAAAIEYRTAHYGYFEGFGDRRANRKSPNQQSKSTTFFGLPIVLHERVIPALKCVEEQLLRDCSGFDYKPSNLSGLRRKNTYVDGEVSNHVYGIAIDIDPLKNPCCKCLEPWSSSERCRGNKTVWERMAMPRCWVETFERFGFYWLGHDVLEDTMHFEFLGDPDRIE